MTLRVLTDPRLAETIVANICTTEQTEMAHHWVQRPDPPATGR
jgi:hypothetical protein